MNKKGLSYHFFVFVAFLAITTFAFLNVFIFDEGENVIKEQLISQTKEHPIAVSVFVKTADELTPMITYKLPFINKEIFGLNKLPSFGIGHSLFIAILMLISSFIMHRAQTNKFIFILVILAMVPIGYFIMNFILYISFLQSAKIIDISVEQAKAFLEKLNNGFDNVVVPIFVVAGFSLLSLGKIFFKSLRKK